MTINVNLKLKIGELYKIKDWCDCMLDMNWNSVPTKNYKIFMIIDEEQTISSIIYTCLILNKLYKINDYALYNAIEKQIA